ncbi:MAG: diacylglycerol kinase [Synergistaceae bacterium]|jgi:diacylglycerol kinase (ATP)|nr:diacylglycerol kinase [Synergistaceae bacterium]
MKRYDPLSRLCRATRFSLNGLFRALKEEQAFEYEAVVLAVLFAAVLWARLSPPEALALIGGWLAVMALELVNSAVERAFDLISEERNPKIGTGKDMLSAAIFLAILFNIALWVFLLGPSGP